MLHLTVNYCSYHAGGAIVAYSQYKVVSIQEGGCGTVLLGAAGIPVNKMEDELNRHAADGWQVVFMVIEQKRFMLFWSRETIIVTLGRS